MATHIKRDDVESDLDQAIRIFETGLITPVVPGELSSWIASLREALDEVGICLRNAIESIHDERYEQIVQRDAELSARVTQMREEDAQLLADFHAVDHQLTALEMQQAAETTGVSKVDKLRSDLVDLSLAFVVRVKTQEATLSTWQMESFQRDRGLGD